MVAWLTLFRSAIEERRLVHIKYIDGEGASSDRAVRPLGLFFWGTKWSVGAWRELRQDFRSFRLDRIEDAETGAQFADEAGKTLPDFFAAVDREDA